MVTTIRVGVAADERIEPFLRLTETFYSDKPVNVAAVVRWRHLASPLGPSTTVELIDGDEAVGRMWIQVHEWSVGGRVVRAANPCDFLIREDHRRLPAFISLFKATMNESKQLADLVYHTSNPLTDDLYRKLIKLRPVTELDGALLPVSPFGAAQAAGLFKSGVLGRLADVAFAAAVGLIGRLSYLTGLRLDTAPSLTEQERIFAEFVAEEHVCGTRTKTHRDWRCHGAGPIVYQEHWLSQGGRSLGYILTSDREINGVKACFVIDIVLPGRPSGLVLWSVWMQVAALAAGRKRHVVVFLYNRSNPRLKRLASLPMVKVSRERLPQQVPIFVRPSKSSDHAVFDNVAWSSGYFVLSDFDMF